MLIIKNNKIQFADVGTDGFRPFDHHITFFDRKDSISPAPYPKDVSISSVCWPNSGGSRRILLLVLLNVTAGPTIFSLTLYEHSNSCTIPIPFTCSLSNACEIKKTPNAHGETNTRIKY